MSEENKALVRRIVDEAWNRGKLEVINEAFAPDYHEHNPKARAGARNCGLQGGS
jgi:predicted SnoaL-like aldol condensation-catalyzing enzyme